MPQKLPQHIAIIMDGNRRWARAHQLPPHKGHEAGVGRIHEIIKEHFSRKISYLTVWAASIDNLLKRSQKEIQFLILLLQKETEKLLQSEEFIKHRIRVRFVGLGREIIKSKPLNTAIEKVEKKTANFQNGNFTILFGYDGKEEMISAMRHFAEHPTKKLNYETVRSQLWTRDLPPVNLVIRTGGEPHWSSGFMMWHTADSQLYFTDTLWPDFGKKEYEKALTDFGNRRKNFGA